jgi:uncharacterized membrane protein
MQSLEKKLERWTEARLIDALTAERILQFEKDSEKKGLRWPAILAVGFGTLMLCAGVLLFVAAHWDEMSPTSRFISVLAMVAVFHVAGGLLGSKVPMIGVALHTAGTIALGAGIFLAGQIFNLEEHWPGGVMLWALGAAIGWAFLRQWPQALLAALLVPWWLAGEWVVALERYHDPWHIPAQGFLLLAILFLSVEPKEQSKHLRTALVWAGCLALIPMIIMVMETGDMHQYWRHETEPAVPIGITIIGYFFAYVPALLIAWVSRKMAALWIICFAVWVSVLALLSRNVHPYESLGVYLWLAVAAVALCWWGVRENRRLFINYGSAGFAITVIAFYFSSVMDKLGRATGLITMGLVFLLGGWVLNRLRTDLIARAAAAGGTR